jgi:N-acetyl-anhydromuramyl-L-alanine amidase AmpD
MPVSINSQDRINGANSVDLGMPQGTMTPTRVVIHYSGGSTLSSAVDTLRARGLSYNVLIDKDGSYHQARPFNKSSSHAGRSNWKASNGLTNKSSLNASAIGISLVNLGRFDHFRGGKWHWGWQNGQPTGPSIADAEANKHALIYQPGRPVHWTPYDPAQIEACNALVRALVNKYPSITEIVGHHDIAIDDKPDPGPLYPLEALRRELGMQGGLGLEAKVKSPDGEANLRDRPGTDGRVLKVLRNGDIVHIRAVTYTGASRGLVPSNSRTLTGWASVDVDGSNTHGGFMYMKYVTKTPLAPEYAARL